jgi:hypothetical protein
LQVGHWGIKDLRCGPLARSVLKGYKVSLSLGLAPGEIAAGGNGKLAMGGKKVYQGIPDFGGEIPYFYRETGERLSKPPEQEKLGIIRSY